MTVACEKFDISTAGFSDLIDITSKVQNIVSKIDVEQAIVNIQVISPTASILTLDSEQGLSSDFIDLFEEIAPLNKVYKHDLSYHEGNATAHLKAAILGNSITVNADNFKLCLNDWQKIVLADFDIKPSIKTIVVCVVY